jgi:hypothetical protein
MPFPEGCKSAASGAGVAVAEAGFKSLLVAEVGFISLLEVPESGFAIVENPSMWRFIPSMQACKSITPNVLPGL